MTRTYLEGQIQATDNALLLLETGMCVSASPAPEWLKALRKDLASDLTHYRRLLDEAQPEPAPYAPSEAYLKALRSFGLTDEACVEELRRARACDFDLLLAEERRKAYDQGRLDGYAKGYEVGWALGNDSGPDKI
jgi:hypothetical protein